MIPVKKEIRLRIVANSNRPEDQAEKLRVRDAILPIAATLCLSEIQAVVPDARVTRGVYAFGGYASDTILVTLGEGKGSNWWGILFPGAMGISEEPMRFESFFIRLLRSFGWI